MATILNGKKLQSEIAEKLTREIRGMREKPKLAIVQVGDVEESTVYIKHKKKFAERIGALVEHKQYKRSVSEEELIKDIEELNNDKSVHGIIVQLPLPQSIDRSAAINTIDYKKDVDGLTATNVKGLYDNEERLLPATARGVRTLLEENGVELSGKRVTVIGRSSLVGKAIALSLVNRDATVTLCGKYTRDLEGEARRAEVLVVATGAVGLITRAHVNENQIVVDVGITSIEEEGKKRVVGDVKFEEVEAMVGAISPVPGGVGPMTIASLFENLLDAYRMQNS